MIRRQQHKYRRVLRDIRERVGLKMYTATPILIWVEVTGRIETPLTRMVFTRVCDAVREHVR